MVIVEMMMVLVMMMERVMMAMLMMRAAITMMAVKMVMMMRIMMVMIMEMLAAVSVEVDNSDESHAKECDVDGDVCDYGEDEGSQKQWKCVDVRVCICRRVPRSVDSI